MTMSWRLTLASLALLFVPMGAHALTRVFIQNNTPFSFQVETTQTGAALTQGKYWQSGKQTVAAGLRQELVHFNRDEGIKDGKHYQFTSKIFWNQALLLGLFQKLEGRAVGSKLSQAASSPMAPHCQNYWHSDRLARSCQFENNGQKFLLEYSAYFTGTEDNIEYIIHAAPLVPDTKANNGINILAYNVYMRPLFLLNGQRERANIIPGHVRPFDVIIFSEAFADGLRKLMRDKLKNTHAYATKTVGGDDGIEQDGGVKIISRYPMDKEAHLKFKKQCAGSDCMAGKGAIYVRIKKDGRYFHLVGTHLQATLPTPEYIAVRKAQVMMLRDFIKAQNIPEDEPVMLAGDLNIDYYKQDAEFRDMLYSLNAEMPQKTGIPYTYDPSSNILAEGEGHPEWLDYVLYLKDYKVPVKSFNEGRLLRSLSGWKDAEWKKTRWDLSDHYPVLGHFEFD